MFILFEGLDLSGKSTLCRALRDRLGWEMRRNSLLPPGSNPAHARAESARLNREAPESEIGRLYWEAVRADLGAYQPTGQPRIQDSTILLRSIAHHEAAGNRELAAAFRSLLPSHPVPLLAFVCRASREVRLRRLEGRISRKNDADEDFFIRDDPERFAKMEASLEQAAQQQFGAEILDTSFLEDLSSREDLIEHILSLLPEDLRPF